MLNFEHFLLIAIAVGATACTDPSGPYADVPCPDRRPGSGETIVYAMRSIVIDSTDNPDQPHTGFDLDGFVSTDIDPWGCTHPDFRSTLDPAENCARVDHERCLDSRIDCEHRVVCTSSCVGGVDNQLPTLASTYRTAASTDVAATVLDGVATGTLVVLFEVSDIDDFANDPSVTVRMFPGFAAPGTPCHAPATGDAYQIDRAGLALAGSSSVDALITATGEIVYGRLRTRRTSGTGSLVHWPLGGTSLPLLLHQATLAMDISRDGGSRGNFGAWFDGQELVDFFIRVQPESRSFVEGIIGGMADIQIGGSCGDTLATPRTYGGISIGWGFEAARIVIDSRQPVVDAPAPGTCEAPQRVGGMD